MKYIKLFENFDDDDTLYEIDQILTTLNPPSTGAAKPELLRSELDNNILFYKVDHLYEMADLNTTMARLEDLGYRVLHNYKGFTLIKSNYFKDDSIKGVCLQWLNEKFDNLKQDDDNKAINYVDDQGNKIIRFYKQRDKGDNYLINQDLVWSFFNKSFTLNYKTTQEIISTWLKDKYNLTEMAPFAWVPKPQ